jgi:hypothetical protein
MENSSDFTIGQRTAVAWYGNKIKVRLPWTMLYFYDPTQMKVIDGAVSYDGGRSFDIQTTSSDGVAVSVYYKGIVTSSTNRYTWNKWLVVPSTVPVEKKSLQVIEGGLSAFPRFAD